MDENIKFSVIVHMEGANRDFFRAFLESLSQNTYKNYELVITDAGGSDTIGSIAQEFFPEQGRLVYRRVRAQRTRGYALNYAASLAKGDFFLFFDRHSRLSPIALFEMARAIGNLDAELVYSDNDELVGIDRMNPDFKCGPNMELLRHRNYIGDIFAISAKAFRRLGYFKDVLNYAPCYDLLIRSFEKKVKVTHIQKLLYSKRIIRTIEDPKAAAARTAQAYKEHLACVSAHLKRSEIAGEVKASKRNAYWNISYNGSDYRDHRRDYLVLRDNNVKVRLRDALPKMYALLKQPDVGVVGCAMTLNPFSYNNCGFIYDTTGNSFPACHGQSLLYDGYNYRCILPQDVSVVDFGFCLIKRKVYKGLNGFDKNLSGRDLMLDFCIRARRAGYRTVYEPSVRARKKSAHVESDISSNEFLMEKWGDIIEKGDPFYNRNLPMGIDNYFLY